VGFQFLADPVLFVWDNAAPFTSPTGKEDGHGKPFL
jgi:hypothetical protein